MAHIHKKEEKDSVIKSKFIPAARANTPQVVSLGSSW